MREIESFGWSLGELLKFETERNFCREAGVYTNDTGADVTFDVIGMPVVFNDANRAVVLVTAATQANVNGVLVAPQERVTVADGESIDVVVLRRGPALINPACLATEDVAAGAALTEATLLTALATNSNIRPMWPAPTVETTGFL